MKKIIALSLFVLIVVSIAVLSQTGGLNIIGGVINFSTATHTLPTIVVATTGALPSTGCTPGELAVVNAATLGQQLYQNSGTGACVWTQQLNSGAGGTGTSVTNTTPVTVSTNTTSDQQLMELSMGAGYFNSANQPFLFNAAGVYTTPVGQTPTLTFKLKLCTISGCGSGTVVTLVSIVSTATLASSTNNNWNFSILGYTHTTGATGNLEIHGPLSIDLGALTTTADSIFNDTNTAVSGNINLTAALFVDFTVATSSGSASNSITQRQGGVMPFAATGGVSSSCTTGQSAFGCLLEQHTLSSSSTSNFTTCISASYDTYLIELVGVTMSTDTADMWFRVHEGGVYDSGANYNSNGWLARAGGQEAFGAGDSGATKIQLTDSVAGGVSNVSTNGYSGGFTFYNVASAHPYLQGTAYYQAGTGSPHFVVTIGGGAYLTTTAVDGFQFLPSTGTFATGIIRCYGISKT